MTKRDEQREATRARIVDAAIACLIKDGLAACTTVEVQRRLGISRGALLHHFPTHAGLLAATVAGLVERNEAAFWYALGSVDPNVDPVERALLVLRSVTSRRAFRAELELWAAARADRELRSALRRAERAAHRDLTRVVDAAFGPELAAAAGYPIVASVTVQLMRGLAISDVLRDNVHDADAMIVEWARVIRMALDVAPIDGR